MSFTIIHFLAIFCLLSVTVSAPCKLRDNNEDDSEKFKRSVDLQLSEVSQDVNIPDIMLQCNESFRIAYDALQEFNTTGSLPDESDRTPMCYMRCFLEKAFILNEGVINESKVTELVWPATGDSIKACQSEGDEEEHPCRKAYVIAKCMITRALVDAKNKKVE